MMWLLRRRKPNVDKEGDEALFNYALHLAQEWGNDWMSPIQDRLKNGFPHLNSKELDALNSLAQDAMKYGYDLVHELSERSDGDDFKDEWRTKYLSKYGWVDEKNLRDLFATGRHYLMR